MLAMLKLKRDSYLIISQENSGLNDQRSKNANRLEYAFPEYVKNVLLTERRST